MATLLMAAEPGIRAPLGSDQGVQQQTTDGLPSGGIAPSPRDAFTYTVEWAFGVGQLGSVGVTPVQDTLIWVSSGGVAGGTTDTNWILVFSTRTRLQVDSFKQYVQSASAWGYRDMYYDRAEDAVYAGCELNRMDKINATTHALIATYTLTGTGLPGVVRALSGDGDSLYTTNFTSYPVSKFSKTGTNCHAVTSFNTGSVYGLAYARSESQCYGTTANATQQCYRYNVPAWTMNDTTLITQITGGTMGGCEMMRNDTFLVVLGQMTRDSVFCLRRRSGAVTDVGVDAIRAPGLAATPGAIVTLDARVRNFGSTAQTGVPVTCWVDSAGTRLYTGTATIANLPGSDTARVTFTPPTWTVGPQGAAYQVKMFTGLAGDVNRVNDTSRQNTYSFQVRDTLVAPWRTAAVTVDGNIAPGEWTDANRYDISDVLGMDGTPRPAGSEFLYCKHDSQYVYYAVDLPSATARIAYDQCGFYLDENYSRTWAADSSEGNHWAIAFPPGDSCWYRSVPAYWLARGVQAGNSTSSLTSGHLQFEVAIPKGSQKSNYTLRPTQDTAGFYTYGADVGGTRYWGHWPTRMPASSWNNCAAYGTLILTAPPMPTHDVGVRVILAPTGIISNGAVVTPACSTYNHGSATETYPVRMKIGAGYDQTATVSGHAGGTALFVTFPTWTASTNGTFATTCSTELTGDANSANDRATGSCEVQLLDVGVVSIDGPTGSHDTSAVIVPTATVKNYGSQNATFAVTFSFTGYTNTKTVTDLASNGEATVVFDTWAKPHATGTYPTRCSTYMAGDANAANDVKTGSFIIRAGGGGPAGWTQLASVPAGGKSKAVKDGGCLAYGEEFDVGYVYGLKGNSTCEYYKYNTESNTWTAKESIPAIGSMGKKKTVKKGAAITTADGRQYAAKGGGTLEWWQYDPALSGTPTYPWTQKLDVPAAAKTVKEGTGAVTVTVADTEYVYFLRGSGGNEFLRYAPGLNTWTAMAPAPTGTSGKPYKDGSCLATDGTAKVWAHKGSYNEMAVYDVLTNTWTAKTGMPLTGSSGKKKKAKSGAAMAYENGTIYAMKGGGTNEFWSYQCDSDKWTQQTDVPAGSGKLVKGGGAMVWAEMPYAFYVFKGNKTNDFFKYVPATFDLSQAASTKSQVEGSFKSRTASLGLDATPNPFTSATSIRYTLPRAGNASLKLYDVTGQLVTTFASGYHNAGNYTTSTPTLARGIYVLKLTTETTSATRKLIVE
jgi:hypothetical protein